NEAPPVITEEGLVNPEARGYDAGWSRWTSEEYAPVTCDSSYLVNGFQCYGSYCDWVRLLCSYRGGSAGARTWSTYFSEESTNYRVCAGSAYVSGIACQNSYCDNIAIECTTTGLASNYCQWSGYFSEEDPAFVAPTGYFIKGVQCNG